MKHVITRRRVKYVGIALLVLLILIQFFHPAKNQSNEQANDITRKFAVPDSVQHILKASCYDCHSNYTVYPWYSKIQPVDWWLAHHINDGKRGLNFNEFSSYRVAKQYKRFGDIADLVEKRAMPISSYTLIHRYAILNEQQIDLVKQWTNEMRQNMKANYPADSLIMPMKPGSKDSK